MALATFANITATSKQLVWYIEFIQFSGSFNNDKGKKRVFMCLKAPPPQPTHLLSTVVLSFRIQEKAL